MMGFIRATATTLMLCTALASSGCSTGPRGRVADEWKLVGPFKVFARDKTAPPGSPATRRPPPLADTISTAEPQRADDGYNAVRTVSPPSSSNGLFSLRAEDLAATPDGDAPRPDREFAEHSLFAPAPGVDDTFWYLDLGFRMGITRLHETEDRLDRRLNELQKVDLFGVFESPETPIDRKSQFALATAYIGIGRRETEWLTWNFYFGSGVGGDRDHQRWQLANQDVNFDYALFYSGMTVDLYPWGLCQRGSYASFTEHLKAGRPYFVTGAEIGYLRARGWGRFSISPFTIFSDSQRVEDWLFSWLVGVGWEVPVNDRWAFNLQIHYTTHFYRPDEYNSWNLTYAWRYRF
ncbi:MAG: hypothetical protein GY842_07025 [bacterium]|nr:hypothetical protein [bacterium]